MVATEDGGLTYTRQIVLCNLLDVVYLFFNPFVTVIPYMMTTSVMKELNISFHLNLFFPHMSIFGLRI